MANPVTWFEIIGPDSATLQKFYADVFSWKLTPPMPEMGNYSMLDHEGHGIQGGIGGMAGDPPRTTIYIEVDDPEAYLNKATAAGAKTIMPVTNVTEGVTIALFTDPAGNIMGLLKGN
jgi:predicted enzyme related to lactoylglutathione lyase